MLWVFLCLSFVLCCAAGVFPLLMENYILFLVNGRNINHAYHLSVPIPTYLHTPYLVFIFHLHPPPPRQALKFMKIILHFLAAQQLYFGIEMLWNCCCEGKKGLKNFHLEIYVVCGGCFASVLLHQKHYIRTAIA